MAFASNSNSLSGFTDPLFHSQNGNSSNFRPGSHRHPQGGIFRPQRTARNRRTQIPSTTSIRSDLLDGSTPEPRDQSYFDPRLGPIGSGRPRPRSASEKSLDKAIRDQMYSWGDMSNLRPHEPGMDIATCIELYGLSAVSGEQEPPVTTTADSSERDASTAPSEQQAETRATARDESMGEAKDEFEGRDQDSRDFQEDSEVTLPTRFNTFNNVVGSSSAPGPQMANGAQ